MCVGHGVFLHDLLLNAYMWRQNNGHLPPPPPLKKKKKKSSGVDVFNIVGIYSMMALTNSFTILEKYGKHGNSATFLFLAHQGNPERILFFRGPIRGPRLAEEKNSTAIPLTNLKIKRAVL